MLSSERPVPPKLPRARAAALIESVADAAAAASVTPDRAISGADTEQRRHRTACCTRYRKLELHRPLATRRLHRLSPWRVCRSTPQLRRQHSRSTLLILLSAEEQHPSQHEGELLHLVFKWQAWTTPAAYKQSPMGGFKPVTARHRPTTFTSVLTAVSRRLTLTGTQSSASQGQLPGLIILTSLTSVMHREDGGF
jgi:hypothetical protein